MVWVCTLRPGRATASSGPITGRRRAIPVQKAYYRLSCAVLLFHFEYCEYRTPIIHVWGGSFLQNSTVLLFSRGKCLKATFHCPGLQGADGGPRLRYIQIYRSTRLCIDSKPIDR